MLSCSFYREMTFDFFSSDPNSRLWGQSVTPSCSNNLLQCLNVSSFSLVLVTGVAFNFNCHINICCQCFLFTWKIICCCKQWQTAMICSCCSCLITLWALTPNNLKSDLFSVSTINNSVSDVYSDFFVISWRISTVHQSGAGLSDLGACDACKIKLHANTEGRVHDLWGGLCGLSDGQCSGHCKCARGPFRPCCVKVGMPPFRVPRCLPFTRTKCAVTHRRFLLHLRHHVDRPHWHSRH